MEQIYPLCLLMSYAVSSQYLPPPNTETNSVEGDPNFDSICPNNSYINWVKNADDLLEAKCKNFSAAELCPHIYDNYGWNVPITVATNPTDKVTKCLPTLFVVEIRKQRGKHNYYSTCATHPFLKDIHNITGVKLLNGDVWKASNSSDTFQIALDFNEHNSSDGRLGYLVTTGTVKCPAYIADAQVSISSVVKVANSASIPLLMSILVVFECMLILFSINLQQ